MTDYVKYPGAVLCGNCGQMLAVHHAANYADGPFVGLLVQICPTATFRDVRAPSLEPSPSNPARTAEEPEALGSASGNDVSHGPGSATGSGTA